MHVLPLYYVQIEEKTHFWTELFHKVKQSIKYTLLLQHTLLQK